MKKDIDYYKKLLKKQKQINATEHNQHLDHVAWFKNVILVVMKKNDVDEIVITEDDIKKVERDDKLKYIIRDKKIIFNIFKIIN